MSKVLSYKFFILLLYFNGIISVYGQKKFNFTISFTGSAFNTKNLTVNFYEGYNTRSILLKSFNKIVEAQTSNLKYPVLEFFYFSSKHTTSANCVIAVGSEGKEKNSLPNKMERISINEDVSSLIFLHASALPAGNQKAYFNIPNNFDSPDMIGWYEIVYEDGFKETIPIQYGVNIMEWNPGGKKSLDTLEGETGAPQKAYCYEADPVNCSADTTNIKFFAFEWVNKRFGKVIKEVNLYGSNHYQALQQDYGTVVTAPMESNAILLAGISKVKKRVSFKPK